MSLTATHSISVCLAWAARKTLRPMRPKPLIPTRTGMVRPYLVAPTHHLDAIPVRVAQVGRVVAGPVLRPRAGCALIATAVRHAGRVCRVDGRLARRGQRDMAEGRTRTA